MFFWAMATSASVTLHSPLVILDRVGGTTMFKIYHCIAGYRKKISNMGQSTNASLFSRNRQINIHSQPDLSRSLAGKEQTEQNPAAEGQ